ncbi:HTH domain-containing protein [Halogeometricum limi]|nr:HTH domain-containing protein [Halogeometricum limi]
MIAHDTHRSARWSREATGEETDTETVNTRVELWCEASHTGGRGEFDRVAERLRELDARGDVDASAVETWERFVDVSGGYPADERPRETLDRLGRLQRWSWQHSDTSSLDATTRLVGQGRLGPEKKVVRTPRAALVEFENGIVTNVTCADERTGCLTARLERIAEREQTNSVERDDERERPRESRERLRL